MSAWPNGLFGILGLPSVFCTQCAKITKNQKKDGDMQTLTIRVSDSYADKLFALLELFPKNALKLETVEDEKTKELQKHRKAIKESLEDIKHGRVRDTGIVVKMSV